MHAEIEREKQTTYMRYNIPTIIYWEHLVLKQRTSLQIFYVFDKSGKSTNSSNRSFQFFLAFIIIFAGKFVVPFDLLGIFKV